MKAKEKDFTYTSNTYTELGRHLHTMECFHCAARDNLVIHHVDGDQSNCEIKNLIVLCRDCHQSVHGYKSELSPFLSMLREQLDADTLSYGWEK